MVQHDEALKLKKEEEIVIKWMKQYRVTVVKTVVV